MFEHYPALLIAVPLIMAPVCVLLRHPTFAAIAAFVANAAAVFFAIALLLDVLDGNVIRYALGGWAAPTGIEYYIDTTNAILLVIISVVSFLALVYSFPTLLHEVAEPRHYLFYCGWLSCLTGLLGIVITGDVFNVFVFLEISSLAMYMLIALGKERKQALLAAFRYLIMGSIGASFILLGIGFLYAATGTLNMVDLAQRIPEVGESRTVLVAFSLMALGLLIKAAIFPVYSWLPSAYQYAPSAATVFLAGTATKVSLYLLLRFFFHVFGQDYSFGDMLLNYVLLPLSVIGFFVMSVVAIFPQDIRRMLAYSSIAQIGYIVAAISMETHAGLMAGIIHMVNHAFIKAALFMSVFCIIYRVGSVNISDMVGLLQHSPWSVAAFIIAGFALIGIPLTPGFVSKWHLIGAAIDSGWWLIVIMILMSSLMAVIYIGRVIDVLCFRRPAIEISTLKDVSVWMLIPLWLLIAVCVYLGTYGDILVEVARQAAAQLIGSLQ